MRRSLIVAIIACALVGFAYSDDTKAGKSDAKPIVADLKAFKFTAAFPNAPADLFGYNDGEEKLFFYTNGAGEVTVKLPADGDYTVVVKASCDSALNEKAKFKLSIDGKAIGKETTLTSDDPKDYSFTAALKAGERKVKVEFTNDVHKEGEYDRNLYVHAVTLTP